MSGAHVGWIGGTDINLASLSEIKGEICCAFDMNKDFEWAEVNGVRRVVKITMQSASVNIKHGLNPNARIERLFSYQSVYPFDLVSIIDTLILV